MLEAIRFYGAFSHKRLCFGSKGAVGAQVRADIPSQGLAPQALQSLGLALQSFLLA